MSLTARNMLWLSVLSATNIALSIALQFSGIFVLGAGTATDAYFAAQAVPMILGAILAGALTNNLTPMLAALERPRCASLVRAVMMQIALPLTAVVVLLSLTARWWSGALFFGLGTEGKDLVAVLMPVMCATFGVNILTSAGVAGHNAHGRFLVVEGAQLCATLGALALVAPMTHAYGIAGFVGVLLVRALMSFFLVAAPFLKAEPLPVAELTRTLWKRMARIMSGSVVFKLGPVLDRSLASLALPGVLTSLGVGQQVASSTAGVTDRVLSRPLLVAAGARLGSADGGEVLTLYRRQLRIVAGGGIVALLPAAALVAYVVMSNNALAHAMYLHAFGRIDIILLVALSAIPAAASQLSSSLMYAIGDPRAISRMAMLSFAISSAVKVLGFISIGVYAIVAGLFLYQFLNWLFLHWAATRVLRAWPANGVGLGAEDTR